MSLKIIEDIEKCLDPLITCTFMKTGLIPVNQVSYFCHDCNPMLNETFCQVCAVACHKDHQIMKAKRLKTFCFCGKRLHRLPCNDHINEEVCTFWEFDYRLGELNGNVSFNYCKQCDTRYCSFCVFFCHFPHIDTMTRISLNKKDNRCSCVNSCHKDNRVLFYFLKDFSMFRLESLFNTHMISMLLECNSTCEKLFSKYILELSEIQGLLESDTFHWKRPTVSSSSSFHRALTCLYYNMRNVKLSYFSKETRDKICPVNLIMSLCLDNHLEDMYDVKLIKKNMLYLLYKFHLLQDFGRYPRYSAKDYSNISCLNRLSLYSSVRNDEIIRNAYLEDVKFRADIIKLFEKYAKLCKVDNHVSMSMFTVILTIVKLLMQYGVFNSPQIGNINDILECLFKTFKLEGTPPSNEKFKESIFKKIPSLLYIMFYCYNDYIFLESFYYDKTNLKEFSIGKSNFGAKLVSTIFMSNIRYLLRYPQSKRFTKIIQLTFKSLGCLASMNDYFLKTLFSIEQHELQDFVKYYQIWPDEKYNNNYPFLIEQEDKTKTKTQTQTQTKKIKGVPKFLIVSLNKNITQHFEDVMKMKMEIEEYYVQYFTMKMKISDLIKNIMDKIRIYLQSVQEMTNPETLPKGAVSEMIIIIENLDNKKTKEEAHAANLKQISDGLTLTDVQIILNQTGLVFSILKLLKMCYFQDEALAEQDFKLILRMINFYTLNSFTNITNFLTSAYLKYLLLFMNKYPQAVLRLIYIKLKFLKSHNFTLNDYSYLYSVLKSCFNGRYTKTHDAENYIHGFIQHLKCLRILKNFLPFSWVRDMKNNIRDFFEKLRNEDSGVREFYWVSSFKQKLLCKEGEYIYRINYTQYINNKDEEKLMKRAKRKNEMQGEALVTRMQREKDEAKVFHFKKKKKKNVSGTSVKQDIEDIDSLNLSLKDDGEGRKLIGEDKTERSIENTNHDIILEDVTQVTIKGDDIVHKYKQNEGSDFMLNDSVSGNLNEDVDDNEMNVNYIVKSIDIQQNALKTSLLQGNEAEAEAEGNDFIGLENVHNLQMGETTGELPFEVKYDEADNSMIRIEEELHQQLGGGKMIAIFDNENKERKKRILEPFDEDRDEIFFNKSELDIFGNKMPLECSSSMKIKNAENLLYTMIDEENAKNEELIMQDINNVDIEILKINAKKRKEIITQEQQEEIKARNIIIEQKEEMNEKIMKVKSTPKAFVKLLQLIHFYAEDFTDHEFQRTIRKFFPRGDVISVLQQKRGLTDLSMRASVIILMRINYFHSPITTSETHLTNVYLNQYTTSVMDKKSIRNVIRMANLLLFEFVNLVEIIAPSFNVKDHFRFVPDPSEQKLVVKQLRKNVRIYLTEGLLKSFQLLIDKVYAHGKSITGEELCQVYQVFYNFVQKKVLIEALLQGKNLDDAKMLNNRRIDINNSSNDNPITDLDQFFNEDSGGVENFDSVGLIKKVYEYLNQTLEIAYPQFKKNLSEIWISLNRKINTVENYDGIDYLPFLRNSQYGKSTEEKILTEYGKICKFYLQQSKNFKQSPILAGFNCIVHESDYNYRALFVRMFMLSVLKEDIRELDGNCLFDLMNKLLEYDHEELHVVILKYLKDIKPVLTYDLILRHANMEKRRKKKLDINSLFLNELNHLLLYNMLIVFVYISRYDAYHIFENANSTCYNIIKFYQLLAMKPVNDLHDYILKFSHILETDDYNIFNLIIGFVEKIIKFSQWGTDYDIRNVIYIDNLFVVLHNILNCLAEYVREADEDSVLLIYCRMKPIIFPLKRILFNLKFTGYNDLIFEVKLSILNLLLAFVEEGHAGRILHLLTYHFEPFNMFKLCVFLFRVLLMEQIENNHLLKDLSVIKPSGNIPHLIELSLERNLKELVYIRNKNQKFNNSIFFSICYKIYFYLRVLNDIYSNQSAAKCFYAMKKFKHATQEKKDRRSDMKSMEEYQFLAKVGDFAHSFIDTDQINETEYVIFKFLKTGIGCVEVFTYRNKLEYVYFPIIPLISCMRDESYERFTEYLYERGHNFKKIEQLDGYIHQALEECYYSYHLNDTLRIFGLIDNASNFVVYKILVCLINIALCGFGWSQIGTEDTTVTTVAFYFDLVNFLYMSFIISIWFLIRFYPRFQQMKCKYVKEMKISVDKPLRKYEIIRIIFWNILICDLDFLYLFTTLCFSLFSLIFRIPSLKFFQMINFIILSSELFRLIKFIGRYWFEILMLFVMLFNLLVSVSAMSIDFYNSYALDATMQSQFEEDNSEFCSTKESTFSKCLFAWIFYGLRYDIGISTILDNNFSQYDTTKYVKRIILDVAVDIIIKGLWFSLLIAVVLVSYFDYTKSKKKMSYDTECRCFICHLDKDIFLKYKLDFDMHVKVEHNVKNYIAFLMYILTKNPLSLSKVEKYVLDRFRINNIYWIPSQDTQALQRQIKKIRDGHVMITTHL